MRKEPSGMDLTRDKEGMKEMELARLGSLLEKLQHLRSSVCLLYRTHKCGYCMQLNMEAVLLYTGKQRGGAYGAQLGQEDSFSSSR